MAFKTREEGRRCKGYYKLTSLSAARGIPGVGEVALLQAETQNVRIRLDGIDPDATTGYLLTNGSSLTVNGDLSQVRVIEANAGAILHATIFEGNN